MVAAAVAGARETDLLQKEATMRKKKVNKIFVQNSLFISSKIRN